MKNRKVASWMLVCTALSCLVGIARAANTRYNEQHRALMAALEAERKRLGITNRVALFAKYPTPEIQLCKAVRAAPGGEADVSLGGKFAAGTKVLFDNDTVQVVTEALTPAGYRAHVRIPPGSGPTFANAHVFAPVSGGHAQCMAVYVGGKYEWEFSASNGWRLKLGCPDDKFKPDLSYPPNLECRAEFFRAAEPKPFAVRNARLNISSTPYDDNYSGSMDEDAPAEVDYNAEIQKLYNRMMDPKISNAERDRLTKQLEEISQKMVKEQLATVAKMQSPNYAQEVERKRAEFGCQSLEFKVKPDGIRGDMSCGQKVGTLSLKGTMKFAGP